MIFQNISNVADGHLHRGCHDSFMSSGLDFSRGALPLCKIRYATGPSSAESFAKSQDIRDFIGTQGGFGEIPDRQVPPHAIQHFLIRRLFFVQPPLQRAAAQLHWVGHVFPAAAPSGTGSTSAPRTREATGKRSF